MTRLWLSDIFVDSQEEIKCGIVHIFHSPSLADESKDAVDQNTMTRWFLHL